MVLGARHPQRGDLAGLEHLVRHARRGIGRGQQRGDRPVIGGEERGAGRPGAPRGDLGAQALTGAERLHPLLGDRIDHAREEHGVDRTLLRCPRAAQAHQALDALRVLERGGQRDTRSEGVAEQGRGTDPLGIEHSEQIRGEGLLGVGRRLVRGARTPVPAQVHPHHRVLLAQRCEIAEPPPDGAGEHRAVQQHQRRPVAGDVVAQVDAVDGGGDDGHGAPSGAGDESSAMQPVGRFVRSPSVRRRAADEVVGRRRRPGPRRAGRTGVG